MGPKPSMSITLPRNFTFHYNGRDMPTTPEPQMMNQEQDVSHPPPPPRQTFKVRRRKADNVPRDILSDIDCDGLPPFEMTEADAEMSPDSDSGYIAGYLTPAAQANRPITPPKTPVSQITYTLDNKPSESSFTGERLERPSSSCSNFSNSSASSIGSSIQSFPSFGSFGASGSCTSPESDTNDVFHAESKDGDPMFSPDLLQTSPAAKRSKTNRSAMWNDETDNHLMQTYAKYLADPELTPFKMLPGTAPPLGVCSRVAREAKHSWKGSKTWSHWPCTESGTRKRLRKLCKKQPSLSAHYQRLVKMRTPSPFESSSSSPQTRPSTITSASLSTLKSSHQRPRITTSEGPFSTFPSEPATVAREAPRPDQWYQRVGRSQAHQKSQSLQIALGGGFSFGDLESPFDDSSFNRTDASSSAAFQSTPLTSETHSISNQASMLKSPLELHAPIPSNRSSLKRRHGILDSSPDNVNRLENLFAGHAPAPRRPVRDRSFSLGAVRHSTRNLSMSFSRPPIPEMPQAENLHVQQLRSDAADQTRLGSPFAAPANPFNTFPRRIAQPGLDSSQAFRPNLSLEGRFRELAAQATRQ
ncbi:hypothetical protein KVT40_002974 [Elsinoe batatas]|uniref:Uncharacterized protein n=1 Tax=Elsinoe batatas TaxID=2601811 RepID=A0A8K0L5Z3_9PEZI|nr:hypothetical protein KVT40_002974 [Elsinoe batatas]